MVTVGAKISRGEANLSAKFLALKIRVQTNPALKEEEREATTASSVSPFEI